MADPAVVDSKDFAPPVAVPAYNPPGDWRGNGNPPLLGHKPVTVREMTVGFLQPVTRFTAPMLSGSKGADVIGTSILQLPLYVDWTMGDFTMPIQFEAASLVLWMAKLAYADFNGVDVSTPRKTSVSLGSSSGGGEIIAQDGFDVPHLMHYQTATGTLPYAVDPNPYKGYLTVTQYGATAGQGIVLIG